MRLIKFCPVLIIAFMMLGFTSKLPTPLEGTYPLKLQTFTIFDLDDNWNIMPNYAELTESKPEKLVVDFDPAKLNEYKYGSFKMGNNDQKIWFIMSKDSQGFWSNFYIDQNNDNRLTEKEQVKSFMSKNGKFKSFKTMESFSLIPVSLQVSYKGQNREIEKSLYFFIKITEYIKNKANDLVVFAYTASFLDGELRVTNGKKVYSLKVRILDGDSNGCFNDFGKDLLFMDLNNDGFYKKNETKPLIEFYDYFGRDNQRKQLRMVIPPQPAKMAITEAAQEFDMAQLEALPDQAEATPPVNKETKTENKPPASI